MGKHLSAPTGARIIGTLESVPGVALIDQSSISKFVAPGLGFDFDWEGTTKIDWDNQETVYRKADGELRDAPQRVWVDEDGDQWLESELTLEDDEEEDENA